MNPNVGRYIQSAEKERHSPPPSYCESRFSVDFELTPEQQAFSDSVRDFAAARLAPGALERAHAHSYPWEEAKLISPSRDCSA